MPHKQDIRQAIAAQLKKAREEAGYPSAALFCEKHNLSLEQYLSYEEAKTILNASTAMKYCKLLGISLNYLLLGS